MKSRGRQERPQAGQEEPGPTPNVRKGEEMAKKTEKRSWCCRERTKVGRGVRKPKGVSRKGGLLHETLLRGQEDEDWDFNTVVLMILGSMLMNTIRALARPTG